jgi:glycosyltransferase involved in cell wall biosynthesis
MKRKKKYSKSISLMFPLYKDKRTVKRMIKKCLKILKKTRTKFEIVIVDDGCPENSGKIAEVIAKNNSKIKVFFHKKNLGYGAAIKTGLKKCRYECIYVVDGDCEFGVADNDLPRAIKVFSKNDLVITYRYKKRYKTTRIIISWVYNVILRILFKTKFKDISSGARLISKKLAKKITLTSNSPFIGAELSIKSKYAGYQVGEIGIHSYPRTFGTGSSVSMKNIILTIRDMILLFIKLNLKKKF